MAITKPYKFIGFGAMDVTKPYKFIGFGANLKGTCSKALTVHWARVCRDSGAPATRT